MPQPVQYSQRDPRYANKPLGTSHTTIGQGGCTITCIGMKYAIPPDIVNACLNVVGAFAPSNPGNPFEPENNLVNWTKLPIALPGVTFVQRYYSYNNDIVLQNLPCLVEVNAAPIGGTRHWVLYIGNHELIDPWDGKIKPTSTYEPLSFVVLGGEYKPKEVTSDTMYKGLDLTNRDSMRVAVDVWYDVSIRKEYISKQEHEKELNSSDYAEMKRLGYTTVDDIKKALRKKDDDILDLQQEVAAVRDRNVTLARLVAETETENSPAKDLTDKAINQTRVLNDTLFELSKITGAKKATPNEVIKSTSVVKEFADRFTKLLEQNKKDATKAADKPVEVKLDVVKDSNWLISLLHLDQLGRGVN